MPFAHCRKFWKGWAERSAAPPWKNAERIVPERSRDGFRCAAHPPYAPQPSVFLHRRFAAAYSAIMTK